MVLVYYINQEMNDNGHDVAGMHESVEQELYIVLVHGRRDDASDPWTEMVHFANTASCVRVVMSSIWFPIVAFLTPNGHPLVIAYICVVSFEMLGWR